ncbi:non-ribosomal peptide synthetase, partial [Pseudoalteromonas rhizosphaerae]|uniref:non-ribosomal peptide synthetase n=1 Tax=Pseudoalteromonas rhizosphaerae TaxID=2518973 RepID=UPI00384C1ACF
YNMPAVFRVSGQFDCAKAAHALQALMSRHEILRTVYSESPDGPVQTVQAQMPVPFTVIDIDANGTLTADAAIADIIHYQFDLSQDAPLRVGYISQGIEQGILAFNMHHIASDGWSMGILVKEFIALYTSGSLTDNKNRLQYGDYVHWQRAYLTDDALQSQLKYWQSQLAGAPQVHSLRLDYPRVGQKTRQGGVVSGRIEAQAVLDLEAVAKAHGLTLFMLLQGALSLVLSRHSYSQDIVMGTPVANRQFSELEDVIGCFVNTIVLRTSTDFTSISEYLAHIKDVHLEAQANQDVPFEKLVEICEVERSAQYNPLIQIMLNMNEKPSNVSLPGVDIQQVPLDNLASKFDLDIDVTAYEGELQLDWRFDTSLFKRTTIEQLYTHFTTLLTSLSNPDRHSIAELEMLSPQELNEQLAFIRSNEDVSIGDDFVHELVSKRATVQPDSVALVFEQAQMTYGELESASNRLAHYLRAQGVGAEVLVGLCVERSFDMVVGLLGILKAGGAYVPMDPSYPAERLDYMVEDTGIKHLVCQEQTLGALSTTDGLEVISLNSDEIQQALAMQSDQLPARLAAQNLSNLAYVIYTSGSTGKPKGVMIEHLA